MGSILEAIRCRCVLSDDIYVGKASPALSYPLDGNRLCYQLEEHSFWFHHRNLCLLELVKAFPFTGTFLDVGGGNGFTSHALQKAGHDVILIEPGSEGARNARMRGVETVVCSTVEELELPDQQAGAVGMFDVLEHLREDEAMLRYLATKLRPGGRLFLTVPAGRMLWSHEDVTAGHFRRYSLHDLCLRVERAGLHVQYVSYFFSFIVLPILILRSLPSALSLRSKHPPMPTYRREHKGRGFFKPFMNYELTRIRQKKKIPIGSSLILTAERT